MAVFFRYMIVNETVHSQCQTVISLHLTSIHFKDLSTYSDDAHNQLCCMKGEKFSTPLDKDGITHIRLRHS